jgi:hypothetical protein
LLGRTAEGGCPHVDRGDGHMSQTAGHEEETILTMSPEALARTVEDFLVGARDAIVRDDGAAVFDLAQAKYSISGQRNKCLLYLWSAERNLVRRVLDVEIKHEVLRLAVQRLGQTRPGKLEICRQRDQRTPTAKRAARLVYQGSQRILERRFPACVRVVVGIDKRWRDGARSVSEAPARTWS